MAKEEKKAKKYFKVRFHERTNETEPTNVALGVNGNTLVCKRGEEVILPEEYVEMARTCTARYLRPEAGTGDDGKKTTVYKQRSYARCAFDLLGESSEEEYLRMKREGTQKTRESLKGEEE
ncbi:MAG: hypothetical protein J5858_15225 [Lentisphaeria bacterium]|nr:hypothetical protein [Lentisphaeria bacterium]